MTKISNKKTLAVLRIKPFEAKECFEKNIELEDFAKSKFKYFKLYAELYNLKITHKFGYLDVVSDDKTKIENCLNKVLNKLSNESNTFKIILLQDFRTLYTCPKIADEIVKLAKLKNIQLHFLRENFILKKTNLKRDLIKFNRHKDEATSNLLIGMGKY